MLLEHSALPTAAPAFEIFDHWLTVKAAKTKHLHVTTDGFRFKSNCRLLAIGCGETVRLSLQDGLVGSAAVACVGRDCDCDLKLVKVSQP